MNCKRNSNIELLRLFLMLAIFAYHLITHGIGLKNIGTEEYAETSYTLLFLAVSAFLAPATYCFVFISGFYGLKFGVKKAVYLWFICICVSVLTAIANSLSWHTPLKIDQTVLLPLATGKWWFMTNYLELLLLTPFVNKGIACLDKKTYRGLLFLLFIYNTLTLAKALPNLGSNLLGLLNIYLLAAYLRKYEVRLQKKTVLATFFVCSILLVVLISVVYTKLPSHLNWTFVLLSYNNPLIIGMAVSLFYMVYNIKSHHSMLINKISQPAVFIYLVTEGLRPHIYTSLITPPFFKKCYSV